MNHQTFEDIIDQTFVTMHSLTASKGIEYANSDDQLANFKRLSGELGLSPEAVNLVFLTKHIDSIKNFVRSGGESESEPIFGRIDDAILYLILLKSIITEKQAANPVMEEDIEKSVNGLYVYAVETPQKNQSIITEKQTVNPVMEEDDIEKPIDDLVDGFFEDLKAKLGSDDEDCDCPSCTIERMFKDLSFKVSVMNVDDILNSLKKQDGEKN